MLHYGIANSLVFGYPLHNPKKHRLLCSWQSKLTFKYKQSTLFLYKVLEITLIQFHQIKPSYFGHLNLHRHSVYMNAVQIYWIRQQLVGQLQSSKPLFSPSLLCCAFVTLQRFIPLIAPDAPTALVPGAPEPRIYPRSR